MTDEELYLRLVHKYALRVLEDADRGKERYLASCRRRDAAGENLYALSRYTQRLPDAVKAVHPKVAWGHVEVLQFVLDQPLGFDRERVWETIRQDVPELNRAATAALDEL